MIHEAMVLEYSGRYLAFIEWAAGLKLAVFLSLIANVFAPGHCDHAGADRLAIGSWSTW